jgi:CBS domain-containing protein
MTEYRVGTIMHTEFPTLTPETPIRRAAACLVEAQAPAAAVLADDGRLIGILTDKDCFRPALHASYYQQWTGRVRDHMSPEVVSVEVSDDVIGVAELFLASPHRVFPVLDGAAVVGLVHRADVLSLLVRIG